MTALAEKVEALSRVDAVLKEDENGQR